MVLNIYIYYIVEMKLLSILIMNILTQENGSVIVSVDAILACAEKNLLEIVCVIV